MDMEGLHTALQTLRNEEEQLRQRIEPLMAQWRHKQEQIAALERALELLESEPEPSSYQLTLPPEGNSTKPVDLAHRILAETGQPLHYRRLLSLMEGTGFVMPGANPGANLLAHLGRDQRIVRTASGVYGLAEWGLKKPPKKGRGRTRSRTSRRVR
jgi:hypothetical protein